MRHALILSCLAATLAVASARSESTPTDAQKAALQTLNDFIGSWKGTGGPDKPRPGPKDTIAWTETLEWSWHFKGDQVWLGLKIQGGKYFTGGELRYLPEKKLYRLTLTDANKQKLDFDGQVDAKGYWIFERTDKASGETQQFAMNSAADGLRLIYRYATKPRDSRIFNKQFMVAATREGESLGATAKKNECVVTGGLGTMTVTFMGETFYVCCSGCRDAFNEDPAKFVKAFKEKKKKGT